MIYEKSCGAVIYTIVDKKALYLIEEMNGGHFAFCKGHVEAGETEIQTARREIKEETNISVKFIPGFRETVEYSPYKDCMKTVVFFLAEAETLDVKPQEQEVAALYWMTFDEAFKALSYNNDRRVLRKAKDYMGF